jgi:uncharacterized protein DUF4403
MDTPAIWLQTTPQAMAFSGIRVRGKMLEGSISMTGTTEIGIGTAPPSQIPTPLPRLDNDVAEPGQFFIIVPVNISYDMIRQKLQDVLAARTQSGGLNLREVSIYPSAGKLVAGLRIAPSDGAKDGDWVYLTATPQVDADAQVVQLANPAFIPDDSFSAETPLNEFLNDPALMQMLQQQLRLTFQNEQQAIIASANARLTRPLADGFRSEGSLKSAGVSKVLLLSNGIRQDLRASGDLRILYGL